MRRDTATQPISLPRRAEIPTAPRISHRAGTTSASTHRPQPARSQNHPRACVDTPHRSSVSQQRRRRTRAVLHSSSHACTISVATFTPSRMGSKFVLEEGGVNERCAGGRRRQGHARSRPARRGRRYSPLRSRSFVCRRRSSGAHLGEQSDRWRRCGARRGACMTRATPQVQKLPPCR